MLLFCRRESRFNASPVSTFHVKLLRLGATSAFGPKPTKYKWVCSTLPVLQALSATPGIFACGLVFGRGSAFLATAIGLAFGIYETPLSSRSFEQVVPLILFGITGFAMAFASEALRNVMEKLIKAERTKGLPRPEVRLAPHTVTTSSCSAASRARRSLAMLRHLFLRLIGISG
jgi:hypothetical protein